MILFVCIVVIFFLVVCNLIGIFEFIVCFGVIEGIFLMGVLVIFFDVGLVLYFVDFLEICLVLICILVIIVFLFFGILIFDILGFLFIFMILLVFIVWIFFFDIISLEDILIGFVVCLIGNLILDVINKDVLFDIIFVLDIEGSF